MSNIPKQWNRSLASIQNCCQTFLSSCCDYNYRNTTSKPPILVHRNLTAKTTEFSNPFYINTSDKQQTLTKRRSKKRYFRNNLQSRINATSESRSSLNGTITRANGSSKKFRKYYESLFKIWFNK